MHATCLALLDQHICLSGKKKKKKFKGVQFMKFTVTQKYGFTPSLSSNLRVRGTKYIYPSVNLDPRIGVSEIGHRIFKTGPDSSFMVIMFCNANETYKKQRLSNSAV
jgi:hypothetical protein